MRAQTFYGKKYIKMLNHKKLTNENKQDVAPEREQDKVRFEVYGEEMAEKTVKLSGNSGRVYLPPDWVGCRVKIIRIDSLKVH